MKNTVKTLEIWALMGIHAQDTKHAGAWRLHVLASSLDHGAGCDHVLGVCKGGSGKVETAALLEAALALRVKRSTFYAWLADARKWGILNESKGWLYLASQQKLSQVLLCNTIDEHKTVIPAKLLFKPGWKGIVQAAYMKANHHSVVGRNNKLQKVYRGDIVSRRKIAELTGINPRTQRRHNQFIKSKKNFAITTISGSWETAASLNQAARDHNQHRHYFTFNDPQQKDPAGVKNYRRVIAHTLPSRHSVSNVHATVGARGRRRHILTAIQKGLRLVNFAIIPLSSLARPQQANGQPSNSETFVKYARVFQDRKPKPTRRHVEREDVIELTARESFLLRRQTARCGVFETA